MNNTRRLRDVKKNKDIKNNWKNSFYKLPYDVLVHILQNFIEIQIYYASKKFTVLYSFYNDGKWNDNIKELLFEFYGIFKTDKDRVIRLLFLHIKIRNLTLFERYIPERKLIQNSPKRILSLNCDCDYSDIRDIVLKKHINKLIMKHITLKFIKNETNKFKYLNKLVVDLKYEEFVNNLNFCLFWLALIAFVIILKFSGN